MSGLKPITVNTDPAAEAHIYAEDDAAIYESIFGTDGVLTIGQQCESQVISNNKVRVKDGVIVVGGHIARVPYGDYCDCEIANGQSGRNRNDIIIAKFVTTGSGGIDTYTLEVKQGAATTGDATDPALTQNNLYESGKIREMPLYRVKIEGLSIVGVEQMFEIVPTIPTLNAYLAELHNSMVCGDFSTSDEIDTGETWVDGKKIYRRTYITTDTVSPNDTLTIPLTLVGIADTLWIDTQNSYIRSADGGQSYPLPLPRYSGTANYVGVWCNGAGIRIFSDSGWNTQWEKCVTVRYTKK